MFRLVHDDEPTMSFMSATVAFSLKEEVEAIAYFFERNSDWVFWRDRFLVHSDREETNACCALKSGERRAHHSFTIGSLLYGCPNATSSRIHDAAMQLDIDLISKSKLADTGVRCGNLMIDASLKDREAAEDEMPFLRILNISGVIHIQNVHRRAAKENAAE
jgi:hypothetical protein